MTAVSAAAIHIHRANRRLIAQVLAPIADDECVTVDRDVMTGPARVAWNW